MRLTKLSAVLAVVAAFGAACSGSSEDSNSQATSVPDVIGQSLENFREVRSFQTTFSTTTEAEGLRVITNGQAAVEAGALVYAQMSIDTGDSGQQFDELLFASTDLYMKDTAGQWFVLSPWNQGQRPDELSEFRPEDLVVDYEETAGGLIDVEELPDETIDGETFLHRAGRVSFSDVYPDAPSGTDGSVHVDLFLRTNHYLPRRVRVVTSVEFEGAKLEEDATYDFRDYDQPITPPERPAEVRPWRDLQFPEAPCTGDAFEICPSPPVRP
jgi:hypothetical protein